jgi:hypothetical protein
MLLRSSPFQKKIFTQRNKTQGNMLKTVKQYKIGERGQRRAVEVGYINLYTMHIKV